jgi:hypothetical protein
MAAASTPISCSSGWASQADTLTIDTLSAFQTGYGTGNFTEPLIGTFGPTIAASSSVQMCWTSICTPTANRPGAFNVTGAFSMPSSNGDFYFDFTTTVSAGGNLYGVNSYAGVGYGTAFEFTP